MLKTKKAFLAFIVLAVVAVVFRVWQLVIAIDYDTGFFYSDAGFWGVSLYIVLVVGIVAFLALPIIDRKAKSPAFEKTALDFSPRSTLVIGFAFLAAALISAYNLVISFGVFDLTFIANAAVCVSYFAISFIALSHKNIKAATGYICLVVAIAFTAKAAAMFMADTIIARESDQLLIMLSHILAVFFFLAFGRFLSANEAKNSRLRTVFSMLLLALVSVSAVIPKLIVIVAGPAEISAATSLPSFDAVSLAVISIVSAICLFANKAPQTAEAEA